MRYRDRVEAGKRLAKELLGVGDGDSVALGLPRGGVPVAAEVAAALAIPLDVVVVRKLGAPFQPELGIGAIGEEGVRVVNRELVARLGVTEETLDRITSQEEQELARRVSTYRGERDPLVLSGLTAIVIDDGLATGYTARAAIEVARRRQAGRVVLAVPVAAPSAVVELSTVADEVVCPEQPRFLGAVGQWYEDFAQTSDEEVIGLLEG
ncbi:MAG: phosphoribosyltransferase [Acidimicrobiia bacterium]